MSPKVAVVLIIASAAVAGGSAAVALKPAPKPQQAAQPQQSGGPAPGTLGYVAQGQLPDGPGVPPNLAGVYWTGAGGNLCWGAQNGNTAITTVSGPSIFTTMPPNSTISYIFDPQANKVYFTVCKSG